MLNKATLIGRLGGEPEIRYTQSGAQVVNFTLATTERYKGQDGQMQETTEWHRVVAFSRLAEICGEYLHKGSLVYIEGKIQTRKWQDQNGNDRYTTEIVAREMKMLSSRGEGGQGGQGGYGNNNQGGFGNNQESFPEPSGGDFYGGGSTGNDVPF